MLSLRTLLLAMAVVGGVVVVVTVSAPIATGTLSDVQRFAYCSLSASLGAPVCYAQIVVTLYFLRHQGPIVVWLGLAVTTLIGAVPSTAVATIILARLYFAQTELIPMYMTVATVSLCCVFFVHYIVGQRVRHAAETPENDDRRTSDGEDAASRSDPGSAASIERRRRFFDRLAEKGAGDLIYLRTDNHHVRACTTTGTVLLRMRFADAVIDLGDLGMQVHRSYWVATAHVLRPDRRNHRTVLLLTGHHEVPVSRSYVRAVRAALRTRSGYQESRLQTPEERHGRREDESHT